MARIVPTSAHTAWSVLAAIALNGASRSRAGIATATFASTTRPSVRHQEPWTISLDRLRAAGPLAPSITTACGTKYQRMSRYTPGTNSATKPRAIPIAASSTAPNSGVKASKPATKTCPADGRWPSAIDCSA